MRLSAVEKDVLYLCENVFDTILLLSVELEYKAKAT